MLIVRRRGFGTSLKPRFNTRIRDRLKPASTKGTAVLPWGCTFVTGFNNIVNQSEAVKLLSNKPKFRKLLSTSQVRVPVTFYTANDAKEYLKQEKHLALIGRRRYHFGARNFYVCNTSEDIDTSVNDGCVYWQELLPKDREFRLFVAFGRVWTFMEKIPDDRNKPAWNHAKGAHFVNVRRDEWLSKACWMALEAQRLSGIDIAAFDIILSGGKLYMLEGNTAPAITGDYKQGLLEVIFRWIDEQYANTGNLPQHYPIPDLDTKGYRNYILPEIL